MLGDRSEGHLSPRHWVVLENVVVPHLVKKLAAFYGICSFMSMFTTVRQTCLAWARWIQSTSSPPPSVRSTFTLSSHLRFGLKWSLSVFPTITLSSILFSPIRATCPVHLFVNDWTSLIIFGMEHKMLTATSSFSGPNAFLSPQHSTL